MENCAGDIDDIYLEALGRERAEQRSAYLDIVCAGNPELRRRVERLLQAQAKIGSFLESPAPELCATVNHRHTESTGTQIGPYKLLQEIGQGGMGVVYMADQQEPVRRKVALKIIKPGMDTRQVIARFEAERQALSLMEHPNIARVLDAGTTDSGRPYFVMELVKGQPITQYCDDHHLTLRQRLELLLPVCQAVQHAHQKGIVHRDLKPSNILVTEFDHQPVPKVIDFGVAKAISQSLTEKTMFTGFGQIVGTPEYMSPEQAKVNQLDIDTRSDIYSIGVLMYELLTGTTPLDKQRLRSAAWDEMLRIIREEEPPKPSTRLSDSKDSLPAICAQRRSEPAKLQKLVRGDLDWIVMKALEKDRSLRYETASGLSMDLQRYLDDEPVEACPPSTSYRLRKFAKRHRVGLLFSILAISALLLVAVGSMTSAIFVSREQQRTETQRQQASANLSKAMDAVDKMLTEVGESWLAEIPQMETVRRTLLEKALAFYQGFLEEQSDDPSLRIETARAYRRVGNIQAWLGLPAEAETAFKQAIALQQQLVKASASADHRRELGTSYNELGLLLKDTGRSQSARQQLERCQAIRRKLVKEFPTDPDALVDLAGTLHNLALIHQQFGELLEARSLVEEAIRHQHLALKMGARSFQATEFLGTHYESLVLILRALGKYQDAEDAMDRCLALRAKLIDEYPQQPRARQLLANGQIAQCWLLEARQKYQDAEQVCSEALNNLKRLAADFPAVPVYQAALAAGHMQHGSILAEFGKLSEAEQAFRAGHAICQKQVADAAQIPDNRQRLVDSHIHLGNLLRLAGRPQESKSELCEAVVISESLVDEFPTVPSYHHDLAHALNELGMLHKEAGQNAEAERFFRRCQEVKKRLVRNYPDVPEYRDDLAAAHNNIGTVVDVPGRQTDAQVMYREAVDLASALVSDFPVVPKYRQTLADSCLNLGGVLAETGQVLEGERLERRAIELYGALAEQSPEVPEYRRHWAVAQSNLGYLFSSANRPKEAEEIFRQALEIQRKLSHEFPDIPTYREDLADSYGSLASVLLKVNRAAEAEEELRRALEMWEGLVRDFPAVASFRSKLFRARNMLGNILRALSRMEEAAKVYRDSLELARQLVAEFPQIDVYREHLAYSLVNLGGLQFTMEHLTDAEQSLNEGAALLRVLAASDPEAQSRRLSLAGCLSNLALVRSENGQSEEAVAAYRESLEFDPHHGPTLNNLAWLLTTDADAQRREPEQAVMLAKQAVELSPNDGSFWGTLGTALYRTGNCNAAIEALEKAESLTGGESFGYHAFFRAMAHWQLGEKQLARDWFDQAVQWMEHNEPQGKELARFRAEAEELMKSNQ